MTWRFPHLRDRFLVLFEREIQPEDVRSIEEWAAADLPEVKRLIIALRNDPSLTADDTAILDEADARVAQGDTGLALMAVAKVIYGAVPF